jgi:N-acetyl-alpha-D-muramate 1-phosphate uridylyltransferase
MQCLILAGGLGTRVRAISPDRPKALMPIRGRPFVSYQLAWLAAHGVTEVVLSIGHLGAMIRDVVGDGRSFGLSVRYADEGDDLRGTAGAIRFALDQDLLAAGFFVLYGDSYLPIELSPVWAASDDGRHPTMTVMKNDGRWDRSNVRFGDGKVLLYDKRHPDPAAAGIDYIDYGLSVMTADCIRAHVPGGAKADLADVFAAESRAGRLRGFEVSERFYEIGSPQGIADLTAYLQRQRTP